MDTSKIIPHLEVKMKTSEAGGEGDLHLATVDHMEGDKFIKLTRKDSADGQHHWIPVSVVKSVDDKALYVNCTLAEFEAKLQATKPSDNS